MERIRIVHGLLVAAIFVAPARTQVTERISVATGGAQGNSSSGAGGISADARYVAFASFSSNLVAGDTNGLNDVFVRDRQTATTERVSVATGGSQGNGSSTGGPISADGRYVAFFSSSTDLVAGDTNAQSDIFVHDRQSNATERVNVDSSGTEANSGSGFASMSADGRYVAFASLASNLVAGDTNGKYDVFVRDRQSGTTERVSLDSADAQGNDFSSLSGISADGRYVVFYSLATNLVAGDLNGFPDVFVRDRQNGTTERVSVSTVGAEGNALSGLSGISISGDGRYVAFHSEATNLVGGDTNGFPDIFVRDRQTNATERVSVASGSTQGNVISDSPAISADGRFVTFVSNSTNLVAGDTNLAADVFVRDRLTATTRRMSVSSAGVQGNAISAGPSISADGRTVAFWSDATNLVAGDTNADMDAFVRALLDATRFTSQCDPSFGSVIACPCANAPASTGRGCDNSSATGGAVLSASGTSSVSTDSLVFTTGGEKPTALSILTQWTGASATGAVYGMGVRCTSGPFKRLFTKSAVGGSITAPDFGAGDPTVSARSAALGNVILGGQSRWYFVYYRDPIVLGGCPPTSTFNATQTGEIAWAP